MDLFCFLSYFNENQYPDEAKREEIANACNAVIQKPGSTALLNQLAQPSRTSYHSTLKPGSTALSNQLAQPSQTR